MIDVDLLICGSGSLTRALVMALAGCAAPGMSIMLAGRNESVVASMAMLARARAAAVDKELSARSIQCDYSRDGLRRLFGAVRPKIVLVLAEWIPESLPTQGATHVAAIGGEMWASGDHVLRKGDADASQRTAGKRVSWSRSGRARPPETSFMWPNWDRK